MIRGKGVRGKEGVRKGREEAKKCGEGVGREVGAKEGKSSA